MKVEELLEVCPSRQTVEVSIGYDSVNVASLTGQAGTLYTYLAEAVKNAEVGSVGSRGDVLVVWVDEEGVD